MQSKESMAGRGKGVLELKTPSRSPASSSNKPALSTSLWSDIAGSNVCKHGLRANTMVDFGTWQLSPWMILLPVLEALSVKDPSMKQMACSKGFT